MTLYRLLGALGWAVALIPWLWALYAVERFTWPLWWPMFGG